MVENNNPNPNPNPKPDWIASVLTGALTNPQQLFLENKKASDFEFKDSPETYWSFPSVKQQFQNNRESFNQFYLDQKKIYDTTKDIDGQYNAYVNASYPSLYARDLGRPLVNVSFESPVVSDPEGRPVFGTMVGQPQWTLHSKANERGVKLPDGNFIGLNKYNGKSRYARNDDGSWKFDEKNLPYIEAYDEEKDEWRSFDEEYSSVADKIGAYGLKNESYFTRPLYGAYAETVNFLSSTVNALSEYIRVPSQMSDRAVGYVTNDDNFKGRLTKQLESFQTSVSSQALPTANYENRNDPWAFANIASMGTQAALQLASMRGVAGLAGRLSNNAETASKASKLYMTGMSAGHVADISREHGLNPFETGALLTLTSIPYYYISSLSEGAIGLTKPLLLKEAAPDMLKKQFGITIAKNGFNPASISSYVAGTKAGLAHIVNNLESYPLAKSITLESFEEVLEETTENGIYSLYDLVYKADTFNVDWKRILTENIPLAAVGGAIGGGIAYKMLKRLGAIDPGALETMEDAAVRGEMWRFYDMWDKMEKNNEFDSDPVKNTETANFLRSVGNSIEEVWQKSGLKKAIHNNELLAKQLGFEGILKETKIGQDLKDQVARLQLAKEKMTLLSQQLADNDSEAIKEEIRKTQFLIDSINEENASIAQGKSVRRWITEGLYNIKNKNNLGALIAKMNIESSGAKTISDSQVEENKKKITENNAKVDVTNFESLEIDDLGLLNLRQSFTNYFKEYLDKNTQSLTKLKNLLEAISPGSESTVDQLLQETNPEKIKEIINDDILGYIELFTSQGETLESDIKSLTDELAQMTSSKGLISRVLSKKSVIAESLGPDRHMLMAYDINNNTSNGLIEDILTAEELISKNGENEDYISSTPDDILKTIDLRREQLFTVADFEKEDSFIKPPVKDLNSTLVALDEYEKRAIKLNESSKKNSQSTEAAVRDIYFKRGDERVSAVLDAMVEIAKSKNIPNFLEINNDITDKANSVKQAIIAKDTPGFNKAMKDFEVSLYKNFASKRDEVLQILLDFATKSYKYDSPEAAKLKETYDFMRGVLSIHPVKLYNLYSSALQKLVETGNAPSMEQRSVVLDSFRSMIAGRYSWATYTSTTHFKLNFSAGVDGASGTGKTSTVTPMLVQMFNLFYSKQSGPSKVILTSAPDELGERRKNLINGVSTFTGSKPEWIVEGMDTLQNLIKNATEDTNLIVYDEATLLNTDEIGSAIQPTLDQVNAARIKAGKSPLHILYTYDKYQNSAKDPGTKRPTSITALRINLPTTPRLTFSFRSQNKPLKIFEDFVRANSKNKKENVQRTVVGFDNKNGVLVIKDRAEFEKVAGNYIESIARDAGKENIVYITTDETTKPIAAVNDFAIKRLTSEQAQGREWDYVILDDKDGNIFADANKAAEYYTGGTRAKKGLIVFVSPDIPLETSRGSVGQFTPLRPAVISKEEGVREMDEYVALYKDDPEVSLPYQPVFSKQSVKAANKQASTTFTPPPVSEKDEPPYDGENYDPSIQQPPFDYGPVSVPSSPQAIEEIRKLIFDNLSEKDRVFISTFFTPSGTDVVLKKNLIYNPVIKSSARYYLTIAEIGSPGYDNIVNPSDAYNGKLGVFVEGEHNGKRAVIGTLANMDEQIRKAGIDKYMVNGTVQIPISSAVITSGVNLYPQIINNKVNERATRDASTRRTLSQIMKESHGLSVSRVMVATDNIMGYNSENPSNPRIPKGTPFVVLSYKHSPEELNNILAKGLTQLTPVKGDESSKFMDITVLGLDRQRTRFTQDEVYAMFKPFISISRDGRTTQIDFTKEMSGVKNAFFSLKRVFWPEPLQDKGLKSKESGLYNPVFRAERWNNVFDTVLKVTASDPDVKAFLERSFALQNLEYSRKAKKAGVSRQLEKYNFSELFNDWLLMKYQLENPSAPKNSYSASDIAAITKLMNAAFNTEEMGGAFFFDVPGKRTSAGTRQKVSYMFAENLPLSVYDKSLTANYLQLTPPQILINLKAVDGVIKNAFNPSGSKIVDTGVDESNNETSYKPNSIKKISISTFINNEFPNSPITALKALRTFRSDLMNSRLNLTGNPPTIVEINSAILNMKNAYANPASMDSKANLEMTSIYGALMRNFDGLLGKYAPDVAYNPDTKEYYIQRGNKKAGAFQAKEELNLFDDGMNNIIKSYLFNTIKVGKTVKNGVVNIYEKIDSDTNTAKFINKSDIQRIASLFEDDDTFLDKLKNSNDDAAFTLYVKFFSKEKNGQYSSLNMIEDENAFHLVTAMRQFLKGAEEYIPGFSKKFYSDEGYKTEYQYPLSGGRPDALRSSVLSAFGQQVKSLYLSNSIRYIPSSSNSPEELYINGESIYKATAANRDSISDETVVNILKKIIGQSYSLQNLSNFLALRPIKGLRTDGEYKEKIVNYFYDSVKNYAVSKEAPDAKGKTIIDDVLDSYSQDNGLNYQSTFIAADGTRQYIMRQTSPIMRLTNEINYLRENIIQGNPSHLLSDNLLARADSNYFISDVKPFNHQGVSIKSSTRDTSKSLADMSEAELLEVYLVDGFANSIAKNKTVTYFPVTVYADATTEISPAFGSTNWMRDSKEIMGDIFNSRVDYFVKLENQILDRYNSEFKFGAKSINELNSKLINNKLTAADLDSKEGFVRNLYYETTSAGNVLIKQTLVDDINAYRPDAKSRDNFYNKINQNITELLDYAKSNASANSYGENLLSQVKNVMRGTPHDSLDVIKSFYLNWLAVTDAFQKIQTGAMQQYKSDAGKQMIEMVKRAKLLISPGTPFIYRSDLWFDTFNEYKSSGRKLPMRLKWEGKKLNKISTVAVIEDFESLVMELDNGETSKQKSWDGATFVNPITRLMQAFASGKGYGITVDAVMKNATKSFDYNRGINKVVKNAEFEITPELMRRGSPLLLNMTRAMFNQQFPSPITLNDGTVINNALDFLASYGVDVNTFSNVDRSHFTKLLDDLVENGVQDYVIQELIPPSSMKTGVENVNKLSDKTYRTQKLDIRNKVMQQDAIKDPTRGLDTKVLTQAVQAISINWSEPDLLTRFYTSLSEITKDFIDGYSQSRNIDSEIREMIERELTDKEEFNYRTEAIAAGLVSKNDRMMSGLFTEKLASHLKKNAVAFNLRGGHYIVHPTSGLIELYDVTENASVSTEAKVKEKTNFNPTRIEETKRKKYAEEVTAALGGIKDIKTNVEKTQIVTREGVKDAKPQYTFDVIFENGEKTTMYPDGGSFTGLNKYFTDEGSDVRFFAGINYLLEQKIAELEDTPVIEGKKFVVFRDQLDKYKDDARYTISAPRTNLNYTDAFHIPTGKFLTQLYADAKGSQKEIEKIHTFLQDKSQWISGEAEILLPMEMKTEFMLDKAFSQNLTLNDINQDYFYSILTKGQEIENEDLKKSLTLRANLMYDSFSKRITGIVGRIPTSGKHSLLVVKIAGFMNESKNSVFIPAELLKIQGADQDIDKGSYLTYKTLVRYNLRHKGSNRKISTYDRDAYPDYYVESEEFQGISLINEGDYLRFKKAFPLLKLNKEDEKFIKRHIKENELVSLISEVLKSTKNIVEGNISVDKVLSPLRKSIPAEQKNVIYDSDKLSDYLKIHRLNQAGGKSLTGIFANGNKAYNVMYIVSKLTGKKINIAGTKSGTPNKIWEMYAALIGASVDNANEGILGPNGIDNVTAPYVSYLVSQGLNIEQSKQIIDSYKDFFELIRAAERYDRRKAFSAEKYKAKNPDFYGLYSRVDEFNRLSRLLVNRDLPVSQEDYLLFYNDVNKYINTKLNTKTFDLVQFLRDTESEYSKQFIEDYEQTISIDAAGNVSPESISTFNILDILASAPHIKQYVRAMSAVHTYNMTQKAYSAMNYILSNQAYINPNTYRSVSDFVHSAFVESYLNNRKFNEGPMKITEHDLSDQNGRKKFIAEFREGLSSMKAKYSKNTFVQSLVIGNVIRGGSVTSEQIVKLPSFYEMGEEKKITMMSDFKLLPARDKIRTFIYNLIVTRDGSGSGSMSGLFSPDVKSDYVNFLDNEIQVDNATLEKEYVDYMNYIAESFETGVAVESDIIIPFSTRTSAIQQLAIKTQKYKETNINALQMPYIPGYGVSNSIETKGTEKNILYNESLLKVEFRNKAWTKLNWISTVDGTKVKTLPSDFFKNDKEYINFILELNSLRLTISTKNYVSEAEFIDSLMNEAAKTVLGKSLPTTKTQEQYLKEAKQCGIA